MICPHCGYEKNTEDALCCNLCHELFRKKGIALQEKDKQEIATFNDLPDELKVILSKEKDEVNRSSQDNFIDSKKMMLIGILLVFILLIVGGIFVLLPVVRTILTKGQG
ncbi:hypothetical protein KKE26_07420 [bacterium]|nr:hypothetical protein [bacterium]MBU1753939.1 hypothetical protein [bacterium]